MSELNHPENQINNNEHGNKRSKCEHGRQRSRCKDCGGSGICEHGRIRRQCKDCGGSGVCEHGRQRSQCKDCGVSGSNTIHSGTKRKIDQRSNSEKVPCKKTKKLKRVLQLLKENEIRVVSKSPPSPSVHICKYIFNNK